MIADIKQIFSDIRSTRNTTIDSQEGKTVSVNQFTHNVGGMYEKVRYMVDYKDEHTIRRNAISRLLKRITNHSKQGEIGSVLLTDLVSGKYLPNDQVSERNADILEMIVLKYVSLMEMLAVPSESLDFASVEIERFLNSQVIDDAIAKACFQTAKDKVEFEKISSGIDTDVLLYAACRKKLFDEDTQGIKYGVLTWQFPQLKEHDFDVNTLQPDQLNEMRRLLTDLDNIFGSPIYNKALVRVRNHSIYFLVIRALIEKYDLSTELYLNDPETLSGHVRELLEKIYQEKNKITRRSGFRAVLYILFTKVLIALFVEVPIEKLLFDHVDRIALISNITLHPIILAGMIMSSPKGDAENTSKIINGVQNIVYGREDGKKIYLSESRTSGFLYFMYAILYTVMYLVVFGALVWVLSSLNFTYPSIILFMLFLALVSYFGMRIRYKAKQWILDKPQRGIINLFFSYLTLPIIRAGRVLSEKFSSVNVFVFVLDVFIETPFKIILGTFDGFVSFLRDKKDESY